MKKKTTVKVKTAGAAKKKLSELGIKNVEVWGLDREFYATGIYAGGTLGFGKLIVCKGDTWEEVLDQAEKQVDEWEDEV